jgi:hypothetical protein
MWTNWIILGITIREEACSYLKKMDHKMMNTNGFRINGNLLLPVLSAVIKFL